VFMGYTKDDEDSEEEEESDDQEVDEYIFN
jgi:hypothetical protein